MESDRIPLYVVLAFCAGVFTGGLGALVGVVIAYVKRDEVTEVWGNSILTYLITTFWVGLVVSIVGWILVPVGIGYIILGLLTVWYLLRCVRAVLAVFDRRTISDPTNFLI